MKRSRRASGLAGWAWGALRRPLRREDLRPGSALFNGAVFLLASAAALAVMPADHYAPALRPGDFPEGFFAETDVRGAGGNLWKAFDGDLGGECFHSERGAVSGSVTLTFPRPFRAARLRIAPQGNLVSRAPRDFVLEGGADGGWEEIFRTRSETPPVFEEGRFAEFALDPARAYGRYRLRILGNFGGEYLTFSEVSLDRVSGRAGFMAPFWLLLALALSAPLLERRFGPGCPPGSAAAALAVLPFTVFLLLPVRVYLGNAAEIDARLAALLPGLAALSLACYGLLGLLRLALPAGGRARLRAAALLAAAGFMAWLQASVWPWASGELTGGSGAMDGLGLFATPPHALFLQAWAWLACLGFALMAPRLTFRFSALLAASVLGAQALDIGRALPDLPRLESAKTLRTPPENLARFSSGGLNGVLIVVDMLQSDVFEELLASGKLGGLELDGFTYYRNSVAAFPLTAASMPHLLTGRRFDNRADIGEYKREAFRSNSLPLSASLAGFGVALWSWVPEQSFYIDRDVVPDAAPAGAGPALRGLALLADAALFEAAPDLLKPAVYGRGLWLFRRALEGGGTTKAADIRMVAGLEASARAVPGPGEFKLIHLAGNHVPMDMDEDLRPARMDFSRESSLRQGLGALKLLGRLLAVMRRLGVYDNSLIIVAADHGSGLEIARPGPGAKLSGWLARGVPLLLAKKPGASGALRVSDAPVSLDDVPRTMAANLGWPGEYQGRDLFGPPAPAGRRRRFVNANAQIKGRFASFREYEVSGHAWDAGSWAEAPRR